MSPSQRERDYARRRHEKWQERQQAKQVRRRHRRSTGVVVTSVLAVVGVLALVFGLARAGEPATAPGDAPEAVATDAATDAGSGAAGNPCPEPAVTPPAEPVQVDAVPDPATAEGRSWTATIGTSCGDVTVELLGEQAPQAVASFIGLANEGFFEGTSCHRLTTQGIYVLQCGDPLGNGQGGPGYRFGPVENAPADDVYPAGTLAMARVGGDAESQGSQFFLVYDDSTIPSDAAGGYTVFGRVTDGLDVIQQVADGGVSGGTGDGQPARAISIEQVSVQ